MGNVVFALYIFGVFLLVAVGLYVLVRTVSVAYFRTRLEYFRSVMREARGRE